MSKETESYITDLDSDGSDEHVFDDETPPFLYSQNSDSLNGYRVEPVETQEAKSTEESTTEGSFGVPEALKEYDPTYLPRVYEMLPESFDVTSLPQSYRENTAKESRLLEYCATFRRQYANLCPDRTRLFLAPVNECGVEKFVCTTLNPVQLPYPELYTWNGVADFVADFLEFVPLLPSTELPKRLLSPATTVAIQKGTSFEYSHLLCSLLLGVGYDAYVVSGYATHEICYMDETRLISPFKKKDPVKTMSEDEEDSHKYTIRPPKDLTSMYENACMARKLKAEKEEEERLEREAAEAEEAANKPPDDPLYGLRVHAWVLVLAGKREVPESFFIEPLTAVAYGLDTALYLGIESLWNAQNYFVNMQDCSTGISHLNYNLEDGTHWEYLLPSGGLQTNKEPRDFAFGQSGVSESSEMGHHAVHVHSTLNFELISHDSTQSSHISATPGGAGVAPVREPKVTQSGENPVPVAGAKQTASLEDKLLLMGLPPSWTLPVEIPPAVYEVRYPGGRKSKLYRYCQVEKFAPYSESTGLVFRLTNYEDRDRQKPVDIEERFSHRKDKLASRKVVTRTNCITEKFDQGRSTTHLAEHVFYRKPGSVYDRHMTFYHNYRVDGLQRREQTSNLMKEVYVGRHDRMNYREVHFGGKVKKFAPANLMKSADGGAMVCVTTISQLNINKIIEKFSREPTLDADEDVAERVFYIIEDRISLTYHIGDERIVPCTREFTKPPPSEDRRATIQLQADTHSTFQVNPFAKPKTQVEIYNMLMEVLAEEEKSKSAVRKSETEVASILQERAAEEASVSLEIDLFDTLRNVEAHELRIELEKTAEYERTRCQEVVLDYLAPFLAQIDLTGNQPSREQVFALREECLEDFKQRLITKANIIQSRFEKESEMLHKKQQWYQLNQINLSKEEEQEYLQYCSDATFRITTLETMLAKHKLTAPQRYMELERKLRTDPRLREFLSCG